MLASPTTKQSCSTAITIAVASVAVGASFVALRRRQRQRCSMQQKLGLLSSIWGNSSATGTQVVSIYDRDDLNCAGDNNSGEEQLSLYVITGATSGLGLQTARHLASLSNKTYLILGCRDVSSGCKVANELKTTSSSDAECIYLDLTNFDSVRTFAEVVVDKSEQLGVKVHALINNAGVYSLPGTTSDGYQITFQTNTLSPVLLTELILPHTTRDFRVVYVSSEMMKMVWNNTRKEGRIFPPVDGGASDWDYALSKACQGLHAHQLNLRWAGKHDQRRAFAVEPGLVKTDITRHKSSWTRKLTYLALSPLVRTVDEGTATIMFCLLAPEKHLDHAWSRGDEDDEKFYGAKPFYYANCMAKLPPRCCRRREDAELQDRLFRDIYQLDK